MNPEKKALYNTNSRKSGRQERFNIEFQCGAEVKEGIKRKMGQVKDILSEGKANLQVNNVDVMEKILDFFIASHKVENDDAVDRPELTPAYCSTDRENVDQCIFVTAIQSVETLSNMIADHTRTCNNASYTTVKKYSRGHVVVVDVRCKSCNCVLHPWASSPYLPNQKFLVNYRMAHGYFCSGMLKIQYERMCQAANLDYLSYSYLNTNMQGVDHLYSNCVKEEYRESCSDALREEIGITALQSENEEATGIDIMTDARHGWRKNSQHTDVVCIGSNTHKVLIDEIVSKEDDPVSQRHERLGTVRIYSYLETHPDGPVYVRMHAHDRNMSVNKYIRCEQPLTINQNDTWHALKSVEKEMKKITRGSQHRHGVTWHEELSDKISSVRTHIHHSLRNSQGNELKFRSSLDNIVNHFGNRHEQCDPSSRCRSVENYEPSKIIITDEKAEKMLLNALQNCLIYKKPKDFLFATDTSYVESFNNVMNVFHNKRISFGRTEYFRRSHLAVLYWNENVNRESTSEWIPPARRLAPQLHQHRNTAGKKHLVKPTYSYQGLIWNRFIGKFFE